MAGPRIIMNPVRPAGGGIGVGTKPQLPSVKQLKNVLGAWQFHSPNHEIQWKSKQPAGAVAGKVVVQKPAKDKSGQVITAFVLKSDPKKVYFEMRNVLGKPPPARPGLIINPPPPSYFLPKYFGPVSSVNLPK